jgi:hypothetical protein
VEQTKALTAWNRYCPATMFPTLFHNFRDDNGRAFFLSPFPATTHKRPLRLFFASAKS